MKNSKPITLRKSIQDLGFGNLLKMPLSKAAIKTMQALLSGHNKAMRIKSNTISRYAAALLGYYVGKLGKPESKISKSHAKLDTFINLFVKKFFFLDGKIINIKLFTQLFGVDILEERMSLKTVKSNPSTEALLKYSIQKRPISDFKTEPNLEKLRKMTVKEIKLLLTPRGRFNPKLSNLNEFRAMQHAITLTKKFAKTVNASKRMALSTLIEQLQKTEKMNEELYKNIRKYSL